MERPEPPKRLLRYFLLITYAILLFLLLSRIDAVWVAVKWFLGILSPLFLGVVIAFILHLPMDFFQYKILKKLEKNRNSYLRKLWRPLSLFLTYICVFLFIGVFISLVLPSVGESVSQLARNFPSYLQNYQIWMDGFLSSISISPDISSAVSGIWDQIVTLLQKILSGALSGLFTFTVSLTSGVVNFLFALMLSGFLLYNRKKLFSQCHRLSMQLFKPKATRKLGDIFALINNIFSRFIVGQLTEAMILGVLCFIGMTLFKMPYAALISLVVMITALIPILGAWIGTIPSALILLMVDPVQTLWFVVFIIILQQLEGNFIYPHVVGNAVGLSGLWVLLSIIVGGGLFGVWGMLLGTPTVAVCYRLVGSWLREKEKSAAR